MNTLHLVRGTLILLFSLQGDLSWRHFFRILHKILLQVGVCKGKQTFKINEISHLNIKIYAHTEVRL